MTADPLVTVVVPTYNRERLIGETIESILTQTFSQIELIVVCDGCTDGTEAVVEAFCDPRVILLRQTNSGGPARPRNAGVELARGKYVAFCDDDDLWMPEKLERQVAVMERYPDVALCFTRGITFGDGDFFSRRALKRGVRRNHFRALLFGNFIANSSVLVRKSVLANVGPFNTDKFLRGAEDYDMWLRIAYGHQLIKLDEKLIKYRVHPTNLAADRAKGTRRGIHIVRRWRCNSATRSEAALPLIWQWFKWVIYSVVLH